jgi:LPXTG-motif cell wall-anchored protein
MAIPWLRILDAALGIHDIVRPRRSRPLIDGIDSQALATGGTPLVGLEARLAGVVVAALKEAFDRDTRRLELERQQLEAERRHAERLLQLELLRQAGDREIGKLRLVAGLAGVSFVGSLFFGLRVVDAGGGRASLAPKLVLAGGWALLLAAIALSFSVQSTVARVLERAVGEQDGFPPGEVPRTGEAAIWLIVVGLALIGLSALLS